MIWRNTWLVSLFKLYYWRHANVMQTINITSLSGSNGMGAYFLEVGQKTLVGIGGREIPMKILTIIDEEAVAIKVTLEDIRTHEREHVWIDYEEIINLTI